MSDDADRTQERLELEEKIRRKYQATDQPVKGTGRCLYCNAEISIDRRWCDQDCMNDYQYYVVNKIK